MGLTLLLIIYILTTHTPVLFKIVLINRVGLLKAKDVVMQKV